MDIQIADREAVESCKNLLQQADHPVAITGAGISVASGLPTVSAEWQGIELRDFFRLDMFLHSTERFYQYYRHMLRHWQQAKPNPAHYALAEHGMPIITQNIDGLHQRAGSPHVLELHGNLRELVCRGCAAIFSSDLVYTQSIPKCPSCCELLKPDIVLVGEDVYHFATAVDWVGKADLLLIVGTRLEMAPCQQLPDIARRNGAPVITLNRHAEQILPIIVRQMQKTCDR